VLLIVPLLHRLHSLGKKHPPPLPLYPLQHSDLPFIGSSAQQPPIQQGDEQQVPWQQNESIAHGYFWLLFGPSSQH